MAATHLSYYTEHGISPVHYMAASVEEHFERRASLYRTLGLTPLAVRGARVLETAVGSGQNSLYVASLMPASLTLLEPNRTAIGEIRQLYGSTGVPHTPPALVESTLQDYTPPHRFDIVICENWLGRIPGEKALLRKLMGFLDQDGIMVVTTITPTGFLPNLIRRALSVKYCDPHLPFAERTERLVAMFGPHLATMSAMTRTATDWVQDNMMNPAYFDICLTIPDVLHETGGMADALGTSPSFANDWRWFKALHGEAREFNRHMIREYEAALHNFFDYQLVFAQPDAGLNRELEKSSLDFLEAVRTYESAALGGKDQAAALKSAVEVLEGVVARLGGFPNQVRSGLDAGLRMLASDDADYRSVAAPGPFSRLFGRETVYISLQRNRKGVQ